MRLRRTPSNQFDHLAASSLRRALVNACIGNDRFRSCSQLQSPRPVLFSPSRQTRAVPGTARILPSPCPGRTGATGVLIGVCHRAWTQLHRLASLLAPSAPMRSSQPSTGRLSQPAPVALGQPARDLYRVQRRAASNSSMVCGPWRIRHCRITIDIRPSRTSYALRCGMTGP